MTEMYSRTRVVIRVRYTFLPRQKAPLGLYPSFYTGKRKEPSKHQTLTRLVFSSISSSVVITSLGALILHFDYNTRVLRAQAAYSLFGPIPTLNVLSLINVLIAHPVSFEVTFPPLMPGQRPNRKSSGGGVGGVRHLGN